MKSVGIFFRSSRYERARNYLDYIKRNYPGEKIKILLFYYPPNPNWKAFAVGVDFKREDIRDPHLSDLNYKFINEDDFLSKNF